MRFPHIKTLILWRLISRSMDTMVTSELKFSQSIKELCTARVRLLLVTACFHFLSEACFSVKELECTYKYPKVYIHCMYK